MLMTTCIVNRQATLVKTNNSPDTKHIKEIAAFSVCTLLPESLFLVDTKISYLRCVIDYARSVRGASSCRLSREVIVIIIIVIAG